MSKDNLLMLDLGQQLAEDKSGAFKKQLIGQLSDELSKIQQAIAMGLTSHQFAGFNQLKTAIEQAKYIINTF